jgi:hypothetical protein
MTTLLSPTISEFYGYCTAGKIGHNPRCEQRLAPLYGRFSMSAKPNTFKVLIEYLRTPRNFHYPRYAARIPKPQRHTQRLSCDRPLTSHTPVSSLNFSATSLLCHHLHQTAVLSLASPLLSHLYYSSARPSNGSAVSPGGNYHRYQKHFRLQKDLMSYPLTKATSRALKIS